jgi:hypothetical protein
MTLEFSVSWEGRNPRERTNKHPPSAADQDPRGTGTQRARDALASSHVGVHFGARGFAPVKGKRGKNLRALPSGAAGTWHD